MLAVAGAFAIHFGERRRELHGAAWCVAMPEPVDVPELVMRLDRQPPREALGIDALAQSLTEDHAAAPATPREAQHEVHAPLATVARADAQQSLARRCG